jgi:hypothetical protein
MFAHHKKPLFQHGPWNLFDRPEEALKAKVDGPKV